MADLERRRSEVLLLCNPRAGGRWRELAKILDTPQARRVRRIVMDDVADVRAVVQSRVFDRASLVCVYGGNGTLFHLLDAAATRNGALPPIAILGGGTMNVTARWCGMGGSPVRNFTRVMSAHERGTQDTIEVPLLAVADGDRVRHGFTFGMGPVVRLLRRFEERKKGRARAVWLAAKALGAGVTGHPGALARELRPFAARVDVDGVELSDAEFAAVFANVTGTINPGVKPFVTPTSRVTFHVLAYSAPIREIALRLPLLARGRLPLDRSILVHPLSSSRESIVSLIAAGSLPADPRYVNRSAAQLVIVTGEPIYTIDGEIFERSAERLEVSVGPAVRLVRVPARGAVISPVKAMRAGKGLHLR